MKRLKFAVTFLFLMLSCLPVYSQTLSPQTIYQYAKSKNYRALYMWQNYIDAEDYRGNTALCIAASNDDQETIRTLVAYGADPQPDCLRAVLYGANGGADGGTFLGMGKIGWTATGLAVAGVGVAAAAGGGGGGGGGGGSSCAGFLGDDGVCYDKLQCVHGHQYRNTCVCDAGYKGDLCDEVVVCSSDYEADGQCATGYWQNTSDVCQSGEDIKYKCVSRTKTTGCATWDTYSDNCLSCVDEGYDLEGGACVAHQCGDNYAAVGMCTSGWNNASQSLCKSGASTLYECHAHTNVDNCSTYSKTEDACSSCASGYDLKDGVCVVHQCDDTYATVGTCASGWNNTSQPKCQSGSTIYYKCQAHTTVEHCETYNKTANKCQSCNDGWDINTSTNKCLAHNCGDNYAAVGMCVSGWNNTSQTPCVSGDSTLYQCQAHTNVDHCTIYSKTENKCATCEEGYEGDNCATCASGYGKWGGSGDQTCYLTLTCQHGTTQFEDSCNCGDTGFTGQTCSECASGQTDPSGNICYAKLACEHGTSQVSNTCDCADTGFTGTTCGDCASGDIVDDKCYADAGCEHGMTQSAGVCQCTNGWSGDKCQTCASGQVVGDICYSSITCQNGGTQSGDACVCINGWSGSDCSVCNSTVKDGYCYDKPLVCVHGVMGEEGCECDNNWTGTLCETCPSGNVDGDTCYTNPLQCNHGGTVVSGACSCTGGWTGRTCNICPSGDSSGDTCYPSQECLHGATQSGGVCHCAGNWTGDKCQTCPSGIIEGDVCSATADCVHGYINGATCTCYDNWEGSKCDTCASGQSSGNICFDTLNCVHGYQSLGICICEKGWTGTLCDEGVVYNNYNKEKEINVEKTGSTTPVVGLEYTTSGDKVGDSKTLYNAYVKTDSETGPLELNDTYSMSVTNTNPQTEMNTYGLKNDIGPVYGAYADGTAQPLSGSLNSQIDVVYINNSYDSNTTYALYGIYANGDAIAIGKNNANDLDVTNEINVSFRDTYAYDEDHKNRLSRISLYGMYSLKGDVENSEGSSVKLTSEIDNPPSSWTDNNQPYSYMYGAYSARGNVLNKGSVLLEGATGGPSYGLYAIKTADNKGSVSVSGASNTFGVFGYQEALNTSTVTSTSSSGYAYGIRSYGNIANTNGSVTAAVSSGDAYGLYSAGSVTNTNSMVKATGSSAHGISADTGVTSTGGTITATGSSGQSYGISTTSGNVTNSSTINASGSGKTYGISANAMVSNTNGNITATSSSNSAYGIQTNGEINNQNGQIKSTASNGNAYGIYTASGSTNNTGGSVSASSSLRTGEAYGIYTTKSVDMSKIGTVSASATGVEGKATAVYFGQGNLVLNDTNTQNITATSNNIRYLFEGAAGTSISNAASINAGLKASVVTNTGSVSGARYGINAMNTATNSGTVKATGSSALFSGSKTYGIYANSTVDNTAGTVEAIGVSSSSYSDIATYGIYSQNGSIDSTQGKVTARGRGATALMTQSESITNAKGEVTAISSYGGAQGIYTTSGMVDNQEGTVTATTTSTSGSMAYGIRTTSGDINNKDAIINASAQNSAAYGIYTQSGAVNNSGATITSTAGSSYYSAYGIYTQGSTVDNTQATITARGYNAYGISTTEGNVDNAKGTISVTGSRTAYGIYTQSGTINNLRGVVNSSTTITSTGEAYGIYTNDTIDLSKLGTVSASSNEGTAVAVRFGTGQISLNNSNTQGLSATGNNIRYLFEGAAGTTIKNAATIEAGLKASFVENSGMINGGRYGIYALSSVSNTGTVYASSPSEAYGIYTNGAIDLSKIGTVSASAPEKAVGIHFGSGTIELNASNVQNIAVTGDGERYLFEGDEGTTIRNSATLSAGLKASIVENTGNINGGQYGIYALNSASNTATLNGSLYGIYTEGNATNSGTITSGKFGISSVGAAKNSGTITTSGTSYNSYGIYTENDADNTGGTISVTTTSAQAMGIYADGTIDNTSGKVTATTSTGTAYGLYTPGAVDLTKLGTIVSKATATSAGTAVGIHFGEGTLELNSANVQNITVTGTNIRYLFEGDTGTTIKNAATISAGLRAGTIENSGSVTGGRYGLYATSSVTNTGMVTANTAASGTVQGIYSNSTVDNSSGTVNATSTNSTGEAYGIWTNGPIDIASLGTINVSATITGGKAIGVHFGDETLTLTNDDLTSLNKITLTGKERYLFEGGTNTSIINQTSLSSGLSTVSGAIENKGNITTKNTGISVSGESSQVLNSGNIIVTPANSTQSYSVYGINAKDKAYILNDTNALIKVTNASSSQSKAYGIYLNNSELNNKGTIQINLASSSYTSGSYGIYATNGSTVRNSGTITRTINNASAVSCTGDACYGGNKNNPPYLYLDASSSYINAATMMSLSSINFNKDFGDGSVLLSTGGSFDAPSLSGNLGIDNEVIENGFDEQYVLKDAIISADTSDLTLSSKSALFDASLEGQDIVLSKKAFSEVMDNQSVAQFLEENYKASNNEQLFHLLKEKQSTAALNDTLDALTGKDVFSRFTFEDLTMMRDLNNDINNKLFANKQEYLEFAGSVNPFNFDGNIGSNSRYALYNTLKNNHSFGLSIAFSDVRSNDGHSNDNYRYDQTFYMGAPIGYNYKGFKMITTPSFGYAYGTYNRDGYASQSYDGKIEKRIVGLTNEIRYPFEVLGFNLAPTAEFNAFGYHIKGKEDEKQYSLNIPSQNNYSIESGFGFNVTKSKEIALNQKLSFNAGVMVYHEFANPYDLDLTMNGMNGSFKITDDRRKDNRIVLRSGADYKFNEKISIGALFNVYMDGRTNTKANLDFRYNLH